MAVLTICMLNSQYIHAAPTPWCLQKGVETYAVRTHTVQLVEGTVNEPEQTLTDRLCAYPAQVYGFCCYIWNISQVCRLADIIRRQNPGALVVFGGPEASFRAAELLQATAADAVICGEGERPLAALMDAVETHQPLTGISGVWTMAQGQVIPGGCCVSRQLPVPPNEAAYAAHLHGRIAYLESSRGCPFSCAFCLSGRNEPVRFRPIAETEQCMVQLAAHGARTIKLIDRTFNCNPVRTYELIDFLILSYGTSIPEGVCFHFEVAADLFEDRLLDRLADAPAGLFQMEAGIQSFHADTLAAVSRKTDTARLEQVLRRLIGFGTMHIHVDLIAGLPYEDERRFGESFDRAYALRPQMLQFGFLKLLYGSRLRQDAAMYGFECDTQPPYEIRSTRWLTAEMLQRMHGVCDALDRIYNSGRFLCTADYLLNATGWLPYALYSALGTGTSAHSRIVSLNDYTQLLYDTAAKLPGVQKDLLRDAMVRDRLASVRGGKLPPVLRVPDRRLRPAADAVRTRMHIPADAFGAALLYGSGERLLAADYRHANPITGHFVLTEYNLSEIIKNG